MMTRLTSHWQFRPALVAATLALIGPAALLAPPAIAQTGLQLTDQSGAKPTGQSGAKADGQWSSTPADGSKPVQPVLYEHDGTQYRSLDDCLRAKKRAKARAAIAGAVIAGAGAALAGGNLGKTALVAGAGALAGREIGRATAKQC